VGFNSAFKGLNQEPRTPLGRDSAVSIENRYGVDGPWIENRWGQIFRTQPLSYSMGTGSLPGWNGREVALTTHSHLVQRLKEEYSFARASWHLVVWTLQKPSGWWTF